MIAEGDPADAGVAPEVLILASREDVHAQAVARILGLEFGLPAAIWSFTEFPRSRSRLAIGDQFGMYLNEWDMERIRSVWWRRPGDFEISPRIGDAAVRAFCVRESDAYLRGALLACGVRMVNDPLAQRRAEYKPYQLKVAREVGLRIPATLMTNDPQAVIEFWGKHGRKCVYKTFRPLQTRFLETRALRAVDLDDIDKVEYAPIIIQALIEKHRDVRVNIFGSDVFGAEVTVRNAVGDLDWRLDLTATWSPHEIPPPVADTLRTLVSRLGLEYGCIDMRVTPDEQYVFFEINPAGQFLFVEIDTGQPLSRAMAALLVR